jgi:F-type H+-transporting ATPase subunit a
MILKHIQLLFIALILSGFAVKSGYSKPQHDQNAHETEQEVLDQEAFNAGEMIIEHVIDSYEWHIMTIGETHISIPLPVIIYRDGTWITFMSSKFVNHHTHDKQPLFFNEHGEMLKYDEHGHGPDAAFGIAIMKEGGHKGKIAYIKTDEYFAHHAIVEDIEAGLPMDISITKNVVALWFSIILILWIFSSIAKSYKTRKGMAPKGLQSVFEPLIIFIRDDIVKSSIGEKRYEKYLPYLLTLFFFIFFNNLLGIIPIIPGGANLTGNIAITGVLAIITFIITSLSANKNYWVHIVNTPGVPWWLKFPIPLMPIVEIMGVFTKPFVLMVRLFANMTAGHIVILGFMSLIFIFGDMNVGVGYGFSVVSILFSVFMSILELLVAFIQAYVFTLLSALYIGMATEESH